MKLAGWFSGIQPACGEEAILVRCYLRALVTVAAILAFGVPAAFGADEYPDPMPAAEMEVDPDGLEGLWLGAPAPTAEERAGGRLPAGALVRGFLLAVRLIVL